MLRLILLFLEISFKNLTFSKQFVKTDKRVKMSGCWKLLDKSECIKYLCNCLQMFNYA